MQAFCLKVDVSSIKDFPKENVVHEPFEKKYGSQNENKKLNDVKCTIEGDFKCKRAYKKLLVYAGHSTKRKFPFFLFLKIISKWTIFLTIRTIIKLDFMNCIESGYVCTIRSGTTKPFIRNPFVI